MAEPLTIHRLTVDDYHAMAEAGILSPDSRVELIDGQIVEKMTIGARHMRAVNTLNELAVRRAGDVVEVSIQNPVRLSRYSEPEPDVALLKRSRDPAEIPRAADVLLLVEVADATLRVDRSVKLPLYAEARIPEVWIVNLPESRVECYRDPSASGYETAFDVGADGQLEAHLVPEMGAISAASVLGA
ncbi:MAG: Uma2 family endonuclease [Rhodothermales bacterium]